MQCNLDVFTDTGPLVLCHNMTERGKRWDIFVGPTTSSKIDFTEPSLMRLLTHFSERDLKLEDQKLLLNFQYQFQFQFISDEE